MIFGSPMLGWSANRYGRKPVLIGCSAILIVVTGTMYWFVDTLPLAALYFLFFWFFITGGAIGPIVAAVSKELFPISISGTAVGVVNLFPFAGAAFFQILIGAVLTGHVQGQEHYAIIGYQTMFLICLAGAVLSLAAALLMQETMEMPT